MENKSDDIMFKTFLPPPSNKSYCHQESFQRIFVAATMQLILIASCHSITSTHCSERSRSCNIFIWSTSAINVIHLFGKKKWKNGNPISVTLKSSWHFEMVCSAGESLGFMIPRSWMLSHYQSESHRKRIQWHLPQTAVCADHAQLGRRGWLF